ncbi:MAG: multicopper oxidase domain-containing protein [Kiritimatiellaeota bacterium]|nr:multicopper oxidase domain-containing protein [Kiritimatiellota bacterium]
MLGHKDMTTGVVRPPEAWEAGRKDTVIALPGEILQLKANFDIAGRYVWHCHIIDHEDNEMMRAYEVMLPGAPSGLSATPSGLGVPISVALTWTNNLTNGQGCAIERALGAGSFVEIARVGANATTYTDTTAAPLTTYNYRVRSFINTGYTYYTAEMPATTPDRSAVVTVQANPVEGGSTTGGGIYISGSNALLTASASNDWAFTGWSDGSTNNPRSITAPLSNITYTANFAELEAIIVTASTNAGGNVTGGGAFIVGSSHWITAAASNGWAFLGWNDGNTNATRSVVVSDGGGTYTALFGQWSTLALVSDPATGGSVTGAGQYIAGSNATISATSSNGWRFTAWNDGNGSASRTVTVTAGGITYTASFAQWTVLDVVSAPTNGGSVTGAGSYPLGTNVSITAAASNGWRFAAWNNGATNSPYSVTVPATNITYTANFVQLAPINTGTSTNAGGSVSGGGQYDVGTTNWIIATASNGWLFIGWSDGVTNNPRAVVVVPGGTNVTAIFAPTAVLTAQASPAAGGSVLGGGSQQLGSVVALTAVANAGWSFLCWSDGVTGNPRNIVVPATGTTYTACFRSTAGIGAALDCTNLPWTISGNAPWYSQVLTQHGTGSAMQSGVISTGQVTYLQVTTNGPGTLMFWWKVSAAPANSLQFYVGTQLVNQISGTADWNQYITYIGTSNQATLTWAYTKNTNAVVGSDAGWVDQVSWLPCPYVTNAPQMYYQNPAGLLVSWVLNSTGGCQFARLLANTAGWTLKTAGDLDGDGVSDLLFQSTRGDMASWQMNADGSFRSAKAWGNLGPWEIKACADYAGTGRGQIFFQTASGDTAYWLLDTNANFQSAVYMGNQGPWRLLAECFRSRRRLAAATRWWHRGTGAR